MMAALADVREKAGISQRELSGKLRRPHNYINLIENGNRMPNICEFVEIVRAIGADPAKVVRRMGRR